MLPDNVATRSGYGALRISVPEMESLLDAWRVRSAGAGYAGDYLPVEKALRSRRRRRNADLLPADAQTLHLFFPAFRPLRGEELKPIASRHHLRAADEGDPAVVFTDAIAVPDGPGMTLPGSPDYVIIECRAAVRELSAEYFDQLSASFPESRLIWLLPSLGHPLFNKLFGRGSKICWLPLIRSAGTGRTQAASGRPLISLKWYPVGHPGDRSDVERLLQLLSAAKKDAKQLGRPEAWQAYGLLKASILILTTLPVPRRFYDDAAVEYFRVFATDELLEELAKRELQTASAMPSLASSMEEAHSILAAMVTRLADDNPRAKTILVAVEAAIGDGRGTCIVVRGHAMRVAMESFLTSVLDTDLGDLLATGIRIETRKDLDVPDVCALPPLLWAGYAGVRDMDLILRHQGNGVTVLLGPLEQQFMREDLERWLRRAAVAQQGSEALGLDTGLTRRAIGEIDAVLCALKAGQPLRSSEGVIMNLEDLFEEQEAGAAKGSRRPGRGEPTAAARPAFRVRFAERGARAYFPERSLLTVMRAGKSEPTEVTVGELRPGDRVVFVDRAVGRTLYELMHDQLVRSPIVGSAASIVRLWHRALAEGYRRSRLTFETLLKRLQTAGSGITSHQTVRSWIRGGVLGPQDLDNVERIAATLGIARKDGRILEEVKRAVTGLRRVHRSFARIVYRTIQAAGSGAQLSDAEEQLLEEHGLQLRDLREAVSVLTVAEVSQEPEMVAVTEVGIQVDE